MRDRVSQHHESPEASDDLAPGSNRSFGFQIAGALAVLALLPWLLGLLPWLSGGSPWTLLLAVAAGFGLTAAAAPTLLGPLNRAWFRLSLLLARVVNPVIMGVLFLTIFVPTGLIRRLVKRDPLGLSWDENARSYWNERKPPGPAPESMRNQF